MPHVTVAPFVRTFALLSGLCLAASFAHAADIAVSVDTRNSSTNPGPFSAGASTLLAMDFRIDSSVLPSGATPTWSGALDDLSLKIEDSVLGSFTITGQDGRWRQISTSGDFLVGGWGSFDGGTLAPFSVVNPALSATPFVLTSISFDFRGPDLVANETTLPGTLSIADFDYLSLVLRFSNADPAVGGIPKSSIIRGGAFSAVDITPIPEPAAWALMLAGLAAVAARARRQARR
jgi:PEP-CTERM motif